VEYARNTNGAVVARLTSAGAVAEVALYGAQLVGFRPKDQEHDVLWLGHYRPVAGKDCWGGIPLCWPWFMVRKDPPHGPFHGFGRFSHWRVLAAEAPDAVTTRLRLGLADSEETRATWPHAFEAELVVTLRRELDLELITRNTGGEPMRLEHCFHTYFRAADATRIRILGLEEAPVAVPGHVSRVFQGVEGPCRIEDPLWRRAIVMEKRGSRQTVLWNSGPVREVNGRQTGEPEWRTQVAVEALRGQDDALVVPPGGEARLGMTIRVEELAP
jgi:D-hexose-6-phosphate mutarotase